jgi:hypothetical protein
VLSGEKATQLRERAARRRGEEERRRERNGSKYPMYHLLKSYDYDIIYSPVFVAIYVTDRRKFVLT